MKLEGRPRKFILFGFLIVLIGFLYDSAVVNIPPQDPTPEVLATYKSKAFIGSAIYYLGTLAMITGLILYLGRVIKNK